MSSAVDPAKMVLPSEEAARALESTLMFLRRTIRIVYIGATAIILGMVFWTMFDCTALVTPVDPDWRAFMIGLGVFAGVLVAVVEHEAWLLGMGGNRAPQGAFVGFAMLALVAAGGFGGDFVARKLWEWRAFHGLHPVGIDQSFTILSRNRSRSNTWLDLQASGGAPFSIGCSDAVYSATRAGDRLVLPVETGRGGVERVTLPPIRDLRQDD